eukprot:gene15794-biopygen13540
MDGRNFFLDGRSSSVQGRYVQTGAPSVHLDGRSVVWTERFRARESGSVRPSSMDGRSARLDGAFPRPRIGLRPSIVHPLRPDGAAPSVRTDGRSWIWTDGAPPWMDGASHRTELIWTELPLDGRRWILDGLRLDLDGTSLDGTFLDGACSWIPARYNVKWCWSAPSTQRTLRPNRLRPSRRSVRPMDAPSKSAPSKPRLRPSKSTLRPSNGRSVQIGSVQAVAPSVQVDAPSVQGGAPSVQTISRSRQFGSVRPSSMDGRSARLDGALRRLRIGLRPPSSKALRPSRGSVRPSRRSARPMDAPSKSAPSKSTLRPSKSALRPSNGRSVQISSVQSWTERRFGRTTPSPLPGHSSSSLGGLPSGKAKPPATNHQTTRARRKTDWRCRGGRDAGRASNERKPVRGGPVYLVNLPPPDRCTGAFRAPLHALHPSYPGVFDTPGGPRGGEERRHLRHGDYPH